MSKLNSVTSLLNGLILVHDDLCYSPKYKIISRQDNLTNDVIVKLISGGGSGHEPAHAGYVGYGMLTTAVCGDVFASPSVNAILQAIFLTGDKSSNIILIAKNYTGDRINFGLALEIVKNKYNYQNIKMILINDDISIDCENVQPSIGKRGLAGTVLMHKIIGAMAQQGYTIKEILDFAKNILENQYLCSIGFTFTSSLNKGLKNIEIGKGIHGEPGVEFIEHLENFNEIIKILSNKFSKKIPKHSKIILLINNLGGTSEFLMNIFYDNFINHICYDFKIEKCLTGSFLTSLNVEGISVTILRVDETNIDLCLQCLEFQTNVPANTFQCNQRKILSKNLKSIILDNETFIPEQEKLLKIEYKCKFTLNPILIKKILYNICDTLVKNENFLNEIDSEFGDGDTGTTLVSAANSIICGIKNGRFDTTNPIIFLQELSQVIYENVGGTSGGLYGLFLSAGSRAFSDNNIDSEVKMWIAALNLGIKTIMKYSWAKEDYRTMLDALITGERVLQGIKNLNKTETKIILEKLATACKETSKKSITMQPKAGRAAYTFSQDKSKTCKYPDPGIHAVSLWTNAIYEAFTSFD